MSKVISVFDTGTYLMGAVNNSKLFDRFKGEQRTVKYIDKEDNEQERTVKITPTAKNVLMAILSHHYRARHDKEGKQIRGYTFLEQRKLAATAGCTRQQVSKAVKILEAFDLITVNCSGSLAYGHYVYTLTDKFFSLIQPGAGASDLQRASSPAIKKTRKPCRKLIKNFNKYIQVCTNLIHGCIKLTHHEYKYINYLFKKKGTNFQKSSFPVENPAQSSENLVNFREKDQRYSGKEHLPGNLVYSQPGAGASSSASSCPGESENPRPSRVTGFDKNFHKDRTFEQRQKFASRKARKLMKSGEAFKKYVMGSKFRRESSDLFYAFGRRELEEYLMLDSPEKCVDFLHRFEQIKDQRADAVKRLKNHSSQEAREATL